MGGGSSKQADVKVKQPQQDNKKNNYKPGAGQNGQPSQGAVQEMDKRKLEAQQQMLAAQQQREALLRQQQEDAERVEQERMRKMKDEQDAIIAKQKEDEQKANKAAPVPYTPPQKKQVGDKEQQKMEEMKRLMNERKQKEAIMKKQREEQEMQMALQANAQKSKEQTQLHQSDQMTMNKQTVIGGGQIMNSKPVIGQRMGADSEEDSEEEHQRRQFGRKQSDIRLFQAQVGTVNYSGAGGLPGAAMSRSPNPLLMNQKQVMVGIEMDNQLCDHEANRKIDMNELKSLLA